MSRNKKVVSSTRTKKSKKGGMKGIPKLPKKKETTGSKIKRKAKKAYSEGKDVVKGIAKAAGIKKKSEASPIKITKSKDGKSGKIGYKKGKSKKDLRQSGTAGVSDKGISRGIAAAAGLAMGAGAIAGASKKNKPKKRKTKRQKEYESYLREEARDQARYDGY